MKTSRSRALAVAAIFATVPAVAAVGPATADGASAGSHASSVTAAVGHHAQRKLAPVPVVSGLDNPRQLAWDRNGRLLVAEAGHGSYGKPGSCIKGPEGTLCIGRSGKISRIAHPATAVNRRPHRIAGGFLSAAEKDGSAAVGSDGVSSRRGQTYVQETYFPPSALRRLDTSDHQNGKLLTLQNAIVADISAYEHKHNPDGEIVDTDPYAVLALRRHILVADAAGDDILSIRHGHISVWATLPGDTKKVDPVPTSLARGRNGSILVGTLYSLVPQKARVLRYSASGKLLQTWRGFTSVTGVVAAPHGHVIVSELLAGCPGGGPRCVPGVVVDIAPNGTRTKTRIPFPAGLAWGHGHLYVSAFSISPARGLGFPGSSGQVWRLR